MRYYPFFLAVLLIALLGGCNKGVNSDFLGKWTFDRDYTIAHLPKEAKNLPAASPAGQVSAKESPSEGTAMADGINGMLNTLKPMLTEQLLGQMNGQTFNITPELITDSSGKAQTYEVVERASANSCSIKTADGEIAAYTIEEGRLFFPTTGSVHFMIYFKRVGP